MEFACYVCSQLGSSLDVLPDDGRGSECRPAGHCWVRWVVDGFWHFHCAARAGAAEARDRDSASSSVRPRSRSRPSGTRRPNNVRGQRREGDHAVQLQLQMNRHRGAGDLTKENSENYEDTSWVQNGARNTEDLTYGVDGKNITESHTENEETPDVDVVHFMAGRGKPRRSRSPRRSPRRNERCTRETRVLRPP